jgi:hypothetical protein
MRIIIVGGRELFIGYCILEGDTKRSLQDTKYNMDEYILDILYQYGGVLDMCGNQNVWKG